MTGGTPLRTLDEDDLLEQILPLFGGSSDLLVAPGDDAAVVSTTDRTVATTDTAVLGRDWLDAWSSGADIGHKVIVQNLADVAAMGGTPTGVLVTLVADPALSLEWVLDHAAGLGGACAEADVAVLGGDLSSAPPVSSWSRSRRSVVSTARSVLRSGARAGDVAGRMRHPRPRCRRPAPARDRARGAGTRSPWSGNAGPCRPSRRVPLAARAGATAMLDVSDGLVRDGARLARASGVVLEVDLAALEPDLAEIARPSAGRRPWRACSPAERSTPCSRPSRADLVPPGLAGHRSSRPRRHGGAATGRPRRRGAVTHAGWDHFRRS